MKKKKTKKKTNLPNGVDEQEFLTVLDNISKRLGNKFKFGYHTYEDMKQQAAIFALEGLKKYDNKRPLENFLWTHVRNRLFNYKRDNYQRPDLPCHTCPFYDIKFETTQNQCTEYKNKDNCSLYSSWVKRNSDKKNIMKPTNIEDTHQTASKQDKIEDIFLKKQTLDIIDEIIPTQYRDLYLRFRYGDKVSKTEQKKIISIIQNILKEHHDKNS